jgi:outer membrane receptor protein involved in Fe transport
VDANNVQTISGQYDYGNFSFRAGVRNFTNEKPSFPTRSYGDLFGRRFFIGVTARF